MTTPRKIVFCIRTWGRGGIETALVQLLRALEFAGVELELRIHEELPGGRLPLEDLPGAVLAKISIPRDSFWLRMHRGRKGRPLYRLLDSLGVHYRRWRWRQAASSDGGEVLVDYDLSLATQIGRIRGRRIGVLHFDPGYIWPDRGHRRRRIAKRLASYDCIVVLCEEMRANAAAIFPAIADKLVVIPNAIDVPRLRAAADAQLVLPAGVRSGRYIVAVSRLAARKDQATLLRGYAAARTAGVDWPLLIVGDGPDRPALEGLAATLDIGTSTHFLGWRENPAPYMANAAVLVHTARYEGSPMVLIEALALGCPIVATRCPTGPADLLRGGGGVLVEVGDHEAVAVAIQRLFHDEALRVSLAVSGPPAMACHLSPEVARRFLELVSLRPAKPV